MLVTKPLKPSIAFEDIDFSQMQRDYEFDLAMESFEYNSIIMDAEKLAIETLNDYNGNESALESQFASIKEGAGDALVASVGKIVEEFISYMGKLLTKLKDWFIGLFSKTKQFVEKYKNDETEIEIKFYDFDDAKEELEVFADDYKKLSKSFADDVYDLGYLIGQNENTNNDIMEEISKKAHTKKEYTSDNSVDTFIKGSILGESHMKSKKVEMKDFVKDMKKFMDVKKVIEGLSTYKVMEKLTKFANKVNGNNNYVATMNKFFTFLSKFAATLPVVYKEVLSHNMTVARKALNENTVVDAEFKDTPILGLNPGKA